MKIVSTILLIAILAGGIYFTIWAIKRTLADKKGTNRRQRRGSRR